MKKIIKICLLLVIGLTSCDPNDDTIYSENQTMGEDNSVNEWNYNQYADDNYSYEGTLDAWGPNFGVNDLVGTKWRVTRVYNGFALTLLSDTIEFISGTEYKLNDLSPRTYTFSGITGSSNKSLSLNYFTTIGGSNYTGQVGGYFIEDGQINGAEFHDNQNVSLIFKVWMEKI